MESAGLPPRLMIDFSHANSEKQHDRQLEVAKDVAGQIAAGNKNIIGGMVESHLVSGRQEVIPGQELLFGQSITDACIDWENSIPLLRNLATAVRERRAKE